MTKSQKLLSQPYLKNRNMFVDAVDALQIQDDDLRPIEDDL